jgi:hypothetical protein
MSLSSISSPYHLDSGAFGAKMYATDDSSGWDMKGIARNWADVRLFI